MATAGVPLWSKTASSNATSDPGAPAPEGMAPSQVNDSMRGMMASVAKWRDDLYGLTTGGTSTAYTVTTNATYASASDMSGAIFTIIPNATSGASPTLAVDGLTARAINISTGVAIPTGYLVSGTPYLVKYVHASTEFIVMGEAGKNTLAALDIITGTSETAIATGDTLPLYDVSATANRRMLVSDFLKVVNALTEDTTPDSSADFVMSYDTSATAAKKIKLSNMPSALPRGYIDGCILSNSSGDATNDIDIAAGVCRDSTNAVDITVPAISGKQLDANWAAGGSSGMRNSAAGIANSTYHIYAVRTAASATADIYAHTSTTVATVLTALQAESGGSSYVYARRIGSIIRESSAIVAFTQVGDDFLRSPVLDVDTTSSGTAAALVTLKIPTGLKIIANINFYASVGNSNVPLLVFSPDQSSSLVTSASAAPLATAWGGGSGNTSINLGGNSRVRTNTSGQVYYATDAASRTVRISSMGWTDSRGKDA